MPFEHVQPALAPPLPPSFASIGMDRGLLSSVQEAAQDSLARKEKAQRSTNFLAEVQEASLASEFAERLKRAMAAFDTALDQEHEIGVRLVSFGQSVTFHVEDIAYHNPSLIYFVGRTDNGQPVTLCQHVSQISFLLMALQRPDPSKPKKPFGFAAAMKSEPQSE
jgi:Family of unknown function (DUF6173)